MLKIGKYEVSNWTMTANSAQRCVTFVSDHSRFTKSILITGSWFDGAAKDSYQINFLGDILKKEYDSIYKDSDNFDSIEAAQTRVDTFLEKLSKLIAFV